MAAQLLLAAGLACTTPSSAADALPQVAAGHVERLEGFRSRFIDARHVDVWLPKGYTPARRYAVVYMHDGQMLFDASTTWNRQAWNVQDTVQRLIDSGRIRDTMIVGVWNNGKQRHAEYFPQKFLPRMSEPQRTRFVHDALLDKPKADAYLRFLVEELKPAIDAQYATRTDAANTFVMGSSMGGTIELDALYAPYQRLVDDLVRERGYEDGRNFETRVFEGSGHNETAWAARVEIPLIFLLGVR